MKPNSDTLVVIPAKNEAQSIVAVISALKKQHTYDILLINDASTDNTANLAENAGATVINLIQSLGAWGAIQTGLRYAHYHGYAIVMTMDGDGQHAVSSLARVRQPVANQQTDVSIGSYIQRGSPSRHIAWHLFRRLSGLNIDDLTSGLRAYNQSAIALLASPAATLLDYQDMGVLLLLRQEKLRMLDVPVVMREREDGQSRIFSSWWQVLNYMLHTLFLILAKTDSHHLLTKHIKRS